MSFDKTKDQILQHGVLTRYYESDNPEDKVVLHEFRFWSARYQCEIIVPRWSIVDGASVPKLLRSIVSKAGELELASLPHDFGYTIGTYHPEQKRLTRKDWDNILKDFCYQQGMPKRKVWYVYSAVRAAGGIAYNNPDKTFFCPEEHKDRYIQEFSFMDIPKENGEYFII